MRWVFFVYLVVTVAISAPMMLGGEIGSGLALLGSSFLGFVGGSGMRGSFYAGNRKAGWAIGLALLLAGCGVAFYSEVFIRLFGVVVSAELWVVLGFLVGFLAARPEDAA